MTKVVTNNECRISNFEMFETPILLSKYILALIELNGVFGINTPRQFSFLKLPPLFLEGMSTHHNRML